MSKPSFVDAYKAEDLDSLLDNIAWTDTIQPALLRERDVLTRALVSSTLGLPVQTKTSAGVVETSREQLAGKIYGIDYIMSFFEKILTRGEVAEKAMREIGINVR